MGMKLRLDKIVVKNLSVKSGLRAGAGGAKTIGCPTVPRTGQHNIILVRRRAR